MAIVVSRTESQLSATTSFQALDNLGGASVSSSFTVPTNVTSIKKIIFSTCADGVEEYVPLLKISGNAMRDGDAVFAGAGQTAMPSSVGSNSNMIEIDTDLAVQPGNSVEMSVAVTDAATISVGATLQFA
tara:strand:+ start:51 stop:440 length:390 start_codon:yes stop_codon:yes gene_type:complete